jgi:choline monooxygenase
MPTEWTPTDYTAEVTYAGTRRPVATATTLIPDAYTSEAYFAVERERVFAGGWVAVGCTGEVPEPGNAIVVDVAGRSVIVARGRDGVLRGFYNVCRHRGTRLLDEGPCRVGRFIRCPYHSWAYDLEGRCLGAPLFDHSGIPDDQRAIFDTSAAPSFDKADHGLLPVAVETFGPVILACLDPAAGPLAEPLGDLPERLAGYRLDEWRLARSGAYEVEANWKLVGENFMEYYHLPWVHPGLVKVSPMKAHHRWQGAGMYVGFCTSPIASNTEEGGWQGLPALSTLDEDDGVSARFVWLFPNVAVNALPNHTFLMLVRPTAPGHTSETTYLLSHPDSIERAGDVLEGETESLLRFWDEVNREDIGIVERVQLGLSDPAYTGGRMCYRFEEPVHRFQNMVVDRMLGIRRVPPGDAVPQQPMFPEPV